MPNKFTADISYIDAYDQWIAENYPDAVFFVDNRSGEVGVMLGFNINHESTV